jgi:hypothetical protein
MKKLPRSTYLKRRVLAVVLAVALCFVLVKGYAHMTGTHYDCPNEAVLVEQGDTLWGILETHCDGDIREAVYDVLRLVGTTDVYPGQWVQLPQS